MDLQKLDGLLSLAQGAYEFRADAETLKQVAEQYRHLYPSKEAFASSSCEVLIAILASMPAQHRPRERDSIDDTSLLHHRTFNTLRDVLYPPALSLESMSAAPPVPIAAGTGT